MPAEVRLWRIERQRNPAAVQAGFKFILSLSMDPAPDDRDFASYFDKLRSRTSAPVILEAYKFQFVSLFSGLVLVSKIPEYHAK